MLRSLLVLAFCNTLAVAAPTQPARAPGVRSRDTSSSSPSPMLRGDIVRLKSGGIVRGTIDERFPGEFVVITTPLGIARRFDWREVIYAGPAPEVVDTTASEVSGDSEPTPSRAVKAASPTASTTSAERREESSHSIGISTRSTGNGVTPDASRGHDEQAAQRSASKAAVSTPALVIGSVGIALLGVGVVSGFQWSYREGQLAAFCGEDGSCSDGRPRVLTIEEESQAIVLNRNRKTYRALALTSTGLGVAALVTGTVLLLTSRVDMPSSPSAQLLVPQSPGADRGGISLRLRF